MQNQELKINNNKFFNADSRRLHIDERRFFLFEKNLRVSALDLRKSAFKMENFELSKNNLFVSSGPHIQTKDHIVKRMWATFFALIPAGVAGVYIFGIGALYVIAISIITALITEFLCQRIRGRNTRFSTEARLSRGYSLPIICRLKFLFSGLRRAIHRAFHRKNMKYGLFRARGVGQKYLCTGHNIAGSARDFMMI